MDTLSKVVRSDVNSIASFPVAKREGYDNIRFNVLRALDFNYDILDIPAAPIMLTVGPAKSDFKVTLKFYQSAIELFNVAFADVIFKYKNCMYEDFEYLVKSSKFVVQLNQILDEDIVAPAVEAMCRNVAREFTKDSEVISVMKNTPEIYPVLEALNDKFLLMSNNTFDSIESLRFFVENNKTVVQLFTKEIRVDSPELGCNAAYGSSLISKNLLGIFDIKYVSELINGCLSVDDFSLICSTYNNLSEEGRTLDNLKKLTIKLFPQEKQEYVFSFLESLYLKKVFRGQ